MGETVFSAILMLVGFGSILFLAYVTTKFIAGKSNAGIRGKYLSIIETVSLGVDKKLCLIQAADELILIAVSGKRIDFLCKVDIGELRPDSDTEKEKEFDFKSLFEKYVSLSYRNKGKKSEDLVSGVEDRSFSTNLDKLRSMTGRLKNQSKKDRDKSVDED